jgi:hypothetical protein
VKPIPWLEQNASGFSDLSPDEREAIFHFSLLWTIFEARALNTMASAKAIRELVAAWAQENRLNVDGFAEPLRYFSARYFKDGEPTEKFHGLHLRQNDAPDLVRSVLRGDDQDATNRVVAALIVAYRLRNNLFHGVKWGYGIKDQLNNFLNASAALMAALEIVGPLTVD